MPNNLSLEEYQRETRVMVLKNQALILMEVEKLKGRYDPFIAEVVILREKIERLEMENQVLKQRIAEVEKR